MDFAPVLTYLVLFVIVGVGYLIDRRTRRKYRRIANEGLEPAFTEELSFPSLDAEQLEAIRGRVDRVCISRGGLFGRGGEDLGYMAYLIDVNGVIHDLETDVNEARLVRAAQALAETLDVPLDRSY